LFPPRLEIQICFPRSFWFDHIVDGNVTRLSPMGSR
jgi:hypothetical protein